MTSDYLGDRMMLERLEVVEFFQIHFPVLCSYQKENFGIEPEETLPEWQDEEDLDD